MNELKLDLDGLNQAQLRAKQELVILTIGRLKHGLYNAEAAMGLSDSIDLLENIYNQIKDRFREIGEAMEDITITTDIVIDDMPPGRIDEVK